MVVVTVPCQKKKKTNINDSNDMYWLLTGCEVEGVA